MKKTSLILALALIVVVCSAILAGAEPGVQNGNSLSIVEPAGGAYVIITKLDPDFLHFKFGWNNSKQFEHTPVGYWLGIYDVTNSHYLWGDNFPLPEDDPKMLKLSYTDTSDFTSGNEYSVNFFVRYRYGPAYNVAVIEVHFIAP